MSAQPEDRFRLHGVFPSRWVRMRYHPIQSKYFSSNTRFNIVPAGRRSGKTEIAKRRVVLRAMATPDPEARFFLAAPTRAQAKLIFWDDLKKLVPLWAREGDPKETELTIKIKNGGSIHVIGMDKAERWEGVAWNGGVMDEYANMKPDVWEKHMRAALSDKRGWCDFIGVPEGRNHYYRLNERGLRGDPGYASFHWKSDEILPAREIEEAKKDLDELTYLQEYEASFVNFQGSAYYNFDRMLHTHKALEYDRELPLIFTLDFNVSPGTAAVLQEQLLPSGLYGTAIIDEVWIPRRSNTDDVTKMLVSKYPRHKGEIYIYGDATGGRETSSSRGGSDWDIVKERLEQSYKRSQLIFRVPAANPGLRERLNAVNSRLYSIKGYVRLMIHPRKAPHVVTDFEGVRIKEGTNDLDKKHDPELTHLTDGIGYYIAREFPVGKRKAEVKSIRGGI